jgi:hypothetical protein
LAAPPTTLIIACGALAREVTWLIGRHGWRHMSVTCLPAHLHNRPEKIPEAVRAKVRANRQHFDRILVLYADCGTGGDLDRVLEEEGVERIAGAHCYEFYSGSAAFAEMAEAEPGTFYLTDYLARHFERLIIQGLGIDRHPQLMPVYFGNYRRLVYLAQTEDADLRARAEAAAERLGLDFEVRFTGLGGLGSFLGEAEEPTDDGAVLRVPA